LAVPWLDGEEVPLFKLAGRPWPQWTRRSFPPDNPPVATRERRAYFSVWFTVLWAGWALLMFVSAAASDRTSRLLAFLLGVALLACLPRMVRSAMHRAPPTWPW
jgi:hypothetical protein